MRLESAAATAPPRSAAWQPTSDPLETVAAPLEKTQPPEPDSVAAPLNVVPVRDTLGAEMAPPSSFEEDLVKEEEATVSGPKEQTAPAGPAGALAEAKEEAEMERAVALAKIAPPPCERPGGCLRAEDETILKSAGRSRSTTHAQKHAR